MRKGKPQRFPSVGESCGREIIHTFLSIVLYVPNTLIDLVTRMIGVDVSYATTWIGIRQTANEVRGNPEENLYLLYFHCV